MAHKLVVSRQEILRENARLADHGHEAGIPYPAWQDVKVNVLSDAGPGAFAEIHSQIVAIRAIANF